MLLLTLWGFTTNSARLLPSPGQLFLSRATSGSKIPPGALSILFASMFESAERVQHHHRPQFGDTPAARVLGACHDATQA